MKDGQNQGLDLVSEIAYKNNFKLLSNFIEKSAVLHMEFWSQLSEDMPDLAKLNDIGSKINTTIQQVEDNWQ